MPGQAQPLFLLASPDADLLHAIEPALLASSARVNVVLSSEAAVAAVSGARPPSMILLDVELPGMPIGQLLATFRSEPSSAQLPIILIASAVEQEWIDRMAEGTVNDLILRTAETAYWQLRLDMVLRTQRMAHELENLRDAALRNAQLDRLTGVYNRESLISMLFRETDRAQRSQSSICLVLFDIDDFGHWNSRLGADACDELLCQVATRTAALLRSYDVLGRPGMDEFLVALPACTPANAMMLAERLRGEVFAAPFRVADDAIRLSACFGIAVSHGRSPVVVLREAERALDHAKAAGPESIQCFSSMPQPSSSPVTFLSGSSGDELLAW